MCAAELASVGPRGSPAVGGNGAGGPTEGPGPPGGPTTPLDPPAGASGHRTRLSGGFGLRARVTFAFAVGALVLSATMAGITYFAARQTFLNERGTAAQRQAVANASLIAAALRSPGTQVNQLIESVDTIPGSRSVLYVGGQWYATSISVGQSALPLALRRMVLSGTPASQTFAIDGTPEVAIGIPLKAQHAAYFEVFSLEELAGTLRALAATLGAAALVTTVAGAAVGRWASSRALRPLTGVTEAAVAVAGGQLNTRVESGRDRDLEELAAAFNRMTANVQARIEREARFTSDVSHELRSPLTTLSATVEVLEGHRNELPRRAQRALDLLDGDVRRFTRMVDDLLEISRFDAGSAELSLEEVDPGELVRRSVLAATRSVPPGEERHRTVPVEVDPAVAGVRLRVDKRRFERVMANLLENAALYAGGASRVTVTAVTASPPPEPPASRSRHTIPPVPLATGRTTVQVVVEDRGPGIPAPERARIFERFYRGGRAGQRSSGEGTGLGLSLVAEHVRLHGGTVAVADNPGGGSRFVVELPVDPPSPGTGPATPGGDAADGARSVEP